MIGLLIAHDFINELVSYQCKKMIMYYLQMGWHRC